MPVITLTDPTSAVARAIIRSYYDDIVTRYHGRPVTAAELDKILLDEPSDDLQGDRGAFLVAYENDEAIGCCGIRYIDADTAELTRVFVSPRARGRGLARAFVAELETIARGTGHTVMRLDVRSDLLEARSLYTRLGFREVPAFNDSPYAGHWMAKSL